MAQTFTKLSLEVPGSRFVGIFEITIGDNYATGGYAVAASDFGLTQLHAVIPCTGFEGTGAYAFVWDRANGKLMAFRTGASVGDPLNEVADSDSTIPGAKVIVLVFGN